MFRPRPTPRRGGSGPAAAGAAALAGVLCLVLAAGGCAHSGSPVRDDPGQPGPPGTSRVEPFRGLKDRPEAGPGTNFLLVGLDRRAGISKKDKQRLHVGGKACECTDVMMLLHVSEDRKRIGVVSIPRDSYVEFPPHRERDRDDRSPVRHRGKINGAYKHGGPALTVGTVEHATGVRIDHYLETDFTGFAGTVDRLGGGTVCTGKPLKDRNSGLDLPPGTHHVDGRDALAYVRARHVDPPGDLGRVRRQQRFLVTMMERLFAGPAAREPAALTRMAHALLASVRTDPGLTAEKLAGFGRALRKPATRHAEFATVPMTDFDHRVPGWGSTLLWDEPRAKALFDRLRSDRSIVPVTRPGEVRPVPVAMPPSSVRVTVTEGPGAEPGGTARVARGLRANGFTVLAGTRPAAPGRGGAGGATEPTVIRYDPEWQRYAATLAAALPGARLSKAKGHGRVFEVIVGAGAPRVAGVVHDRSGVEGAPVTGEELDCD